MELSIIIVNWNSAAYTDRCLQTIYDNVRGIEFEIIVVDNASYDGLQGIVSNKYPHVKYVQSHENIGFARANNLGYHESSGQTLLFLNPDTEIIGNAIGTMMDVLNRRPDAGAVSCRLLNTDGTIQTVSVQTFPSIFQQIFDFEYLVKTFPEFPAWKSNPHRAEQVRPIAVDVIIGACIMIKREVFSTIGMFSTDYFMYAEDIDLCYKIMLHGYKTYYIGSASIVHHGGGSTVSKRHSSFKIITLNESVLKFITKSRGKAYALLFRITTAGVAFCRILTLWIVIHLKGEAKKEPLVNSLYQWKTVFSWSIYRVKPTVESSKGVC